jgi:hypothetical protein
METLKLDKSKAIKLFPKASPEFKEMLIDTFGKNVFSGSILDRINSIEDALNEADDETRNDYLQAISGYTTPDRLAEEQLKLIIKVVNEGVKFDYGNLNQKKWFPVFKFSPGVGFVFTYSYYACANAHTYSGSRLCFVDEKRCETIAKRFIKEYNTMLL